MAVVVDFDRCNGVERCPADGVCVDVCALGYIRVLERYPVVSDECPECGLCVMNCPRFAIRLSGEG